MLTSPIQSYDDYLKQITASWRCGKIMKPNPCAHMYWMALRFESLLDSLTVARLQGQLTRHLNEDCNC